MIWEEAIPYSRENYISFKEEDIPFSYCSRVLKVFEYSMRMFRMFRMIFEINKYC